VGERRSDHHDALLIPGALRLLAPAPGQRILDLACGQGVLARALADTGADVVGVDAAPRLIAAAQKASPPTAKFVVGDARTLPALELGLFDHVACVMALMNIDPLEPVMRGIAASLKPGGSFVAILLHPAFRTPGQTSWGWAPLDGPKDAESGGPRAARRHTDHNPGTTAVRQYRRVDGYLSPGQSSVVMNPGEAAKGREKVVTLTYHRPLQTYIRAFSDAHLLVDALEEWPSLRTSEPGPRAAEENRARREIPMFVALRAIKISPSQS
jgi:SAM-dependent methyltransferase